MLYSNGKKTSIADLNNYDQKKTKQFLIPCFAAN